MTTPYHSQYYAYELTKQSASDSINRLSQSLINATVDLNPHQVEAALFAFRAPLEKGALLADEVGLGKTIEAGLVISQLWAERKRKILIIVPPPLRKQWNRELLEKFYIPSIILESKNYNEMVREGNPFPYSQRDQVIITSYQFARNKAADVKRESWDLVIIDEAHRMRNVYKKSNKIARVLRDATDGTPKILLTATPLQNSLMELYGLVSFIDPLLFGDDTTFRKQFGNGTKALSKVDFIDLKDRIKPVCHRTLRRQVNEYVPYTKRIPLLEDFTASDKEWELYQKVSAYLQREDIFAMPKGQRNLMTLVVRKILASSTFAISDTLLSLIKRLENILEEHEIDENSSSILEDIDEIDDTLEEWEQLEEESESENTVDDAEEDLAFIREKIQAEKEELFSYYQLARSINENEKGKALLTALSKGFDKLKELGANQKAVVFTESRRTQQYLKDMLELNGYAGQLVMFNGTNSSPEINGIYHAWLERHKDDDQISGSKSADTRAALVEHFKNHASIMIATESAAEGINLQFCSLVVNYDLPWNPQRIEQRIGRCHRYGQKHDVVVINFLNRKNEADKRVFELLEQKFSLFEGIFGSSDEVLGSLESGVDFEKRIQQIYQTCRSAEAIQHAFNQLQSELDEQIQCKMQETRQHLLENFDDEVREKLRDHYEQTSVQLNKLERYLWNLAKFEGKAQAHFDDDTMSFKINDEKYQLISQVRNNQESHVHHFRLGHPIAIQWTEQAKERSLPIKEIVFDYSSYSGKVSVLTNLIGKSGWLSLDLLQVSSAEDEEHLTFSCIDENGNQIDHDVCQRMFDMPALEEEDTTTSESVRNVLATLLKHQESAILHHINERTNEYLDRELEKLDKWSKDLKDRLEIELKEIDMEISQLQKEARMTRLIASKLELNKTIREREKQRSDMRRNLFDAQDEIDRQKERLFADVEKKLEQKVTRKHLFTIKWRMI